MGLARTWSVALHGVSGHLVEIEADVGGGLPGIHLVGLPDAALHEAKDRVKAAVVNSGWQWPNERIVLGALARHAAQGRQRVRPRVGVRRARGRRDPAPARAERLGAAGRARRSTGGCAPIRGVLPCLLAARTAGVERVVVPAAALAEASLVDGLEVHGAASLAEVLQWLVRGGRAAAARARGRPRSTTPRLPISPTSSGSTTRGTPARSPRRVATTCCWSGRRARARRCWPSGSSGCCPSSTRPRRSSLAAIRSAAGLLPDTGVLTTVPPLIAPHHSTSMAALIGGGSGLPRPGAVSLAHRGVLFLDEAPEWAPHLLDALRTPLEDGTVRLSRAEGTVEYPARFQLVLAANPCPCAPAHDRDCVCPSLVRRRYLGRLSGPLLDRVDLRARMLPITTLATVPEPRESTAQVRVG